MADSLRSRNEASIDCNIAIYRKPFYALVRSSANDNSTLIILSFPIYLACIFAAYFAKVLRPNDKLHISYLQASAAVMDNLHITPKAVEVIVVQLDLQKPADPDGLHSNLLILHSLLISWPLGDLTNYSRPAV